MDRKDFYKKKTGNQPEQQSQTQENTSKFREKEYTPTELNGVLNSKATGKFLYTLDDDGEEVTLSVQPHPFTTSLFFAQTQLKKIVFAIIAESEKTIDANGNESIKEENFISRLAKEVYNFLDDEKEIELMYKFLDNSYLDNGNSNCYEHRDRLFSGKTGLFLDVLTCTLDANYGDLLRKKKFSVSTLFPQLTAIISEKMGIMTKSFMKEQKKE